MSLYRLLSAMDRERFDPAVVSLLSGGSTRDRIEALGVPVYTLGMANAMVSPKSLWRLVRTIGSQQPHIIQGWMYYGSIAASIGAALTPGSRSVLWNIRHTVDHIKQEKRLTAMAIEVESNPPLRAQPTGTSLRMWILILS